MKKLFVASGMLFVMLAAPARGEDVAATPLSVMHPLVGSWKIDFPKLGCSEVYELRADGTKLSRSGAERNEAVFEISGTPSKRGFYRWADKIVKGNGEPDCHGQRTPVGHVSVSYVLLHPSKARFLLCEREEQRSCFAEFHRTDEKAR